MTNGDSLGRGLVTAGLFAGIGGIERGLESAGHSTAFLAENYLVANHVLKLRFPDAQLMEDVADIGELPSDVQLLSAGFPCQDLSSVGPKHGISGTKSRLVGRIFELLQRRPVPWVMLENVPFLLDLDRGKALRLITSAFDELGYAWAYRVLDAEAFGVPQRRRRWFLVAGRDGDPREVLLAGDVERPRAADSDRVACGFYWTEGTRALGWAVNAVPPIKCGSSVGVASPPAIHMPDGSIVTPDIRDAERLQGFPIDWTEPAQNLGKASWRWRLVGNAVCVPVAAWVGDRIMRPVTYDTSDDVRLGQGDRPPKAAWGGAGQAFASRASDTPVWFDRPSLEQFLSFPTKPLSARACIGFLNRAEKGSLRFADGFLTDVAEHAAQQVQRESAA